MRPLLPHFLKCKGYHFDRSDVIFGHFNTKGIEEMVKPILLYDFNDEKKMAISSWDDQQQ